MLLIISTRVLSSMRGYTAIEPAVFAAGGQSGLCRNAAELPASESQSVPSQWQFHSGMELLHHLGH